MVVRDPKTHQYVGIKCDSPGCEIMSPPAEQILAGRGLNNMGWQCWGGTHICPAHAQPFERPKLPSSDSTM